LNNKNKTKGFTLTELLIVIVITGIFPAFAMTFLLNHHVFCKECTPVLEKDKK